MKQRYSMYNVLDVLSDFIIDEVLPNMYRADHSFYIRSYKYNDDLTKYLNNKEKKHYLKKAIRFYMDYKVEESQ